MATLGIRLANALLFVLSCSVAANVITDVGASALIPSETPAPAVARVETSRTPSWEDREVILTRNLFGAQVADEPFVVMDDDEDIEETKLPLKLLGTIASEDPRVASAAVYSTAIREHEVVKVGEKLKSHVDVSVERIERGRIVLRNGSQREVLTLDEDFAAGFQPPAAAPAPRTAQRESRRSRSSSRATVRDRLQELAANDGPSGPSALFSQARILPKYEDGAMVGIELSKIEDNSLYQRVGLQDGDVLTAVNGVPIDNPSATAEVLRNLQVAQELILERRRPDGSIDNVTVDAAILEQFGMGSTTP